MSFSIGSSGAGMGPRGALNRFGNEKEGRAFDRRVVRRMLAYLRPYRGKMTLALLLVVITSLLALSIPYLIGVAIDNYIAVGDLPGLTRISLLIAAVYLALFVASMGQSYLLSWTGQRVLANMRAQLFRHLQALPVGYHDNHIIGVTVSRVINDVAVINDLLSQGLVTLIGDMMMLVGIVVVMISMSPQLALYTFSVLPLMLLATWLFAARGQVGLPAHAFQDRGAGGPSGRGHLRHARDPGLQPGGELAAALRRGEPGEPRRQCGRHVALVRLPAHGRVSGHVGHGHRAAAGRAGRHRRQPDHRRDGRLPGLRHPLLPADPGAEPALHHHAGGHGRRRAGHRTARHRSPTSPIRQTAERCRRSMGEIELADVTFAYRDGTPVLHNIDLLIEAGQTVALVGPTGAGKTSIANLIGRFYDVSDGAVLIDGVDVRAVTQRSLRGQMGLVPQDPFLFSGTVADNIRFGAARCRQDAVEDAARQANAHDFILALPDGYATDILEGGANLSAGQRQLICIARAVLADSAHPRPGRGHGQRRHRDRIADPGRARPAAGGAHLHRHRPSAQHHPQRRPDLRGRGRTASSNAATHRELMQLDGVYATLVARQFVEM